MTERMEITEEVKAWAASLLEIWEGRRFSVEFAEDGSFDGNDGTPGCDLSTEAKIELVDELVREGSSTYEVLASMAAKSDLSGAIAELASGAILGKASALFRAEAAKVLEALARVGGSVGVSSAKLSAGSPLDMLAHDREFPVTIAGFEATVMRYNNVEGSGRVDVFAIRVLGQEVYITARY